MQIELTQDEAEAGLKDLEDMRGLAIFPCRHRDVFITRLRAGLDPGRVQCIDREKATARALLDSTNTEAPDA